MILRLSSSDKCFDCHSFVSHYLHMQVMVQCVEMVILIFVYSLLVEMIILFLNNYVKREQIIYTLLIMHINDGLHL